MKFNTEITELYFISDLHFYHKNILKFNPDTRQGKDVSEMNQILIKNWNDVITNDDHVFILGDISFGKELETWDLVHQLNGQLHLIRGNHDQVILRSKILKCQFIEVLDYKEITVDGIKVCMMHYPISDWNGSHRGSYMLHGHCHGRYQFEGRSKDIGVDNRKDNLMIPFSWNEIHTELSNKPIISQYGRK